MHMLWVCLHLPYLPLDAFAVDPEIPLVVEHVFNRGRRVLLASDAALQAGIRPGMSLSSAFGRCANLQVKSRDISLEQKTLQRLAMVLYNFSPHLKIVEPNEIMMEISSNLNLFGGIEPFLHSLQATIAAEGIRYSIACHDTASGATVLSRQPSFLDSARHATPDDLKSCPLDTTDLDPVEVSRLQGMGLKTLGALFALPAEALGKRISPQSQRYLQTLQGLRPDIRPLYALPEQFECHVELGYESSNHQALLFPLKRLLKALEQYLRGRQLNAATLVLALKHRDLSEQLLTLLPSQEVLSAEEWWNLFRLRLERLTLTQPVLEIRLECREFLQWQPVATDLFDTAAGQRLSPAALVDRLQARLGENRVGGLQAVEDHRPEMAWQPAPPGQPPKARVALSRPVWLLSQPQPIQLDESGITLLQGPERIDSGWWDAITPARDYFIARQTDGTLIWIFHAVDVPDQWFLHGYFG